jgi:hypothetical protein
MPVFRPTGEQALGVSSKTDVHSMSQLLGVKVKTANRDSQTV